MPAIRTFIAVPVTQKIRRNAANLIGKLQTAGADYNWVEEENLHLTLNFVGDLPEVEIPQFCREIASPLRDQGPFGVMVTGLGAFPTMAQPRVIWLGVTEGVAELTRMHTALADWLAGWGVLKERREYQPHLTLGRLKRGGRWKPELVERLEIHSRHDTGWFQASEVVVYSSFLDRSGPTYTPMTRIKLRGAD